MFDEPSRFNEPSRRPGWLGVTCGLLTLGLAGAGWYMYPTLKGHPASLAKLGGVPQSVNALGARVDQQKSKQTEWSGDQEQLRNQVDALRREMRSRIAAARKHSDQSAADLSDSIHKEMQSQFDDVQAKVARLELSRDADQVQISQLQEELGQARQDAAKQTQELSEVRRQMSDSSDATSQRLNSLAASEERDRLNVGTIASKIPMRRVDFEVTKGRNQELAPGISLGITETDVAFRRVSGWMWLLPDRRAIWLRGQGSQEPVVFYGYNDGKKRELVITNVSKGSVAGYLLLPQEAPGTEAASAPAPAPVLSAAASE